MLMFRRCSLLAVLLAAAPSEEYSVGLPMRVARPSRTPHLHCCDDLDCVPATIHGVSTSAEGLCVFISAAGTRGAAAADRLLPLVTTLDDTHSPRTPEALTLLQLLQKIDLGGITFPPEALDQLVSELGVDGLDGWTVESLSVLGPRRFKLRVSADGCELELERQDPWEALALALRYQSPLEVSVKALEEGSIGMGEAGELYPKMMTIVELAQDALGVQQAALRIGCTQAGEQAGEQADDAGVAGSDPLEGMLSAARAVPLREPLQEQIDGPSLEVLQGALRIAQQKGDTQAEAKIGQRIEEIAAQNRNSK